MGQKILMFDWNLDKPDSSALFANSPLFPHNEIIDGETSQDLWFLKLKKPSKTYHPFCLCCSNLSVCLGGAKPEYYFWTGIELELKFKDTKDIGFLSIPRQNNLFHITFNRVWNMKDFIVSSIPKGSNLHRSNHFGLLSISCTMKIQAEECIIHTNPKEISEFEKMFNNKEFSDFTVSTTNKEFNVHKTILATRSEVFAAMFQNDMIETKEGLVKITDFDDKVVEEFLRYIYCGKIEDLERLSEDLLKIADKYSVQELKNICLEEICKKINTENALEILSLIDYHKVNYLKTLVTNFIIMNLKNIDESHFKSLNSDFMLDIFFKAKNFIL